ncbi:type VI secretion system ATPase TssH [Paraferrimonas sedimenticola]|uniref:ClpV1 family T6SS ATPase n=1 Tax=Paraferrimonas sedimenticola TaxID=375674 RepID=A0AA37RX15_9GAMM|nr:type VI secretion system ATPase TssH [Paraferrimonas sedimenticola]GLP96840.1 ClpV1 family T6SS ATPase [Paraferrimonas sedimenticola]
MAKVSRVTLFGKLNPTLYGGLQSATDFCKLRGNPYVELSHWLHQLWQQGDLDLHLIAKHYGLDSQVVQQELSDSLDKLPRGASSISDLSSKIDESVELAWGVASLTYGHKKIRSGHLLLALLQSSDLRGALMGLSTTLAQLDASKLSEELLDVVAQSSEGDADEAPETQGLATEDADGSALSKYTIDMTAVAEAGEMDPVIGREDEIRLMIDILMRRRQNNPILTGEAGVGKTAVVEGFAQRIADGEVPEPLQNVRLLALDIGLLQAGASMKGEFEKRLKQVIQEIKDSDKSIILFIDEAHTLIGAGGQSGTGDAANLLKPELARGMLRTVAATTWSEYKQYIEKDPALTRRFQLVKVAEPEVDIAVAMLRGLYPVLEKHHGVVIQKEALQAAAELSARYLPDRQLPDKAISLLDTACARVATSQSCQPPSLDDCQRQQQFLNSELALVQKEQALGTHSAEDFAELSEQLASLKVNEEEITARWQSEQEVVTQINERLEAIKNEDAQVSEADSTIADLLSRLGEIQSEQPLVYPLVDEKAVAAIVSDWTGIPAGKMQLNEMDALKQLESNLGQRVLGQDHALKQLADVVRISRTRLDDPNKPVGVMLLAGPSGTGKTETALALAEALYGGEQNMITINMSEFQESHTVSTLKGAPPGYVGYGEGGVLTEAIRRKPHSVLLLDEIEKAHPDVHEIFFQVFDKGWMEDGEGRYIDFKNTLILLTSNVGSNAIFQYCNEQQDIDIGHLGELLDHSLREVFPDALIGRMSAIPYLPLSVALQRQIMNLKLDKIIDRVNQHYGATLEIDSSVLDGLSDHCQLSEKGGRLLDAVITKHVSRNLSQHILSHPGLSSDTHLTMTMEEGNYVVKERQA